MARLTHLLGALFLAVALVGCGNEFDLAPGDYASEYEGTWLVNSMTDTYTGVKSVWVREGLPNTVRADVRVETLEDGTHLFIRYVHLAEGVPTAAPTSVDYAFAVTGGTWILENRQARIKSPIDGVHVDPMLTRFVYAYQETPEGITLTWDPADVRNIGTADIHRMYLTRATDWDQATRGVWDVQDAQCMRIGEIYTQKETMIGIDNHLLFEERGTTRYFADDDCWTPIYDADQRTVRLGMIEEDGLTVRQWTIQTQPAYPTIVTTGRYAEYNVELIDADNAVWTRATCKPKTLCEGDVPEQLNLTRAKRVLVQH